MTNGTLTTMVEALTGNYITTLDVTEAGDFTLVGAIGTADTKASVTSKVTVEIVEVDGAAITPVVVMGDLVFDSSDGDWNLVDDGPGPVISGIWNGALSIDLLTELANAGVTVNWGVTKLNMTLDNGLETGSEAGTQALVAKKDVGVAAATVVPEPAALSLALAAMLAVVAIRSRG